MNGAGLYDSSTYITMRGKRVSSVKHIMLIEHGGGGMAHVTFLNTLWWKGDGRLKHSMLMEREGVEQGQDRLCFTSTKLSS